jgi:hypothetical protein
MTTQAPSHALLISRTEESIPTAPSSSSVCLFIPSNADHLIYSPLPTEAPAVSSLELIEFNSLADDLASRNNESVSRTSSNVISVRPEICDRILAGVSSCRANLRACVCVVLL